MSATGLQPEPSAKAPWTSTTVLTAACVGADAARAAPEIRAKIKPLTPRLATITTSIAWASQRMSRERLPRLHDVGNGALAGAALRASQSVLRLRTLRPAPGRRQEGHDGILVAAVDDRGSAGLGEAGYRSRWPMRSMSSRPCQWRRCDKC